jgi:hypothetical protein
MSLSERLALGSADDVEAALRRLYEWGTRNRWAS